MKTDILTMSILFGAGVVKPEVQELARNLPNVKLLNTAIDPEGLLAQNREYPPQVVLVELDNCTQIPPWLETLVNRLPQSAFFVTCLNLDPLFIIKIMQHKVRDYLPSPLQAQDLQAALDRLRADLRREGRITSTHCRTIVVAGAKGGVGATAISTNLAVAMAELASGRVVLVDLARPFPNVGQFLDVRSAHTIMDLVENVDRLDPIFLSKTLQQHSSRLAVLLGYGGLSLNSHPLLEPAVLEKIFQGLRSSYDWIVVDLGHWLDSLYLKVVEDADLVLLISELSVPDLHNLKKIHTYFQRWNIADEKIKVVVNRYAKSFTLGLRDLENIFAGAGTVTFPSDYNNLIEAINQGATLAEVAPRSKLWRQIQDLAADIIATSRPPGPAGASNRPGWLKRLFGAKG